MDFRDFILAELKTSGTRSVSELFLTCIRLCDIYALDRWECYDYCHSLFNIGKVYTVE